MFTLDSRLLMGSGGQDLTYFVYGTAMLYYFPYSCSSAVFRFSPCAFLDYPSSIRSYRIKRVDMNASYLPRV